MPWLSCWLRLMPAISAYEKPSIGLKPNPNPTLRVPELSASFSCSRLKEKHSPHQPFCLPRLHFCSAAPETLWIRCDGERFFAQNCRSLMLAVPIALVFQRIEELRHPAEIADDVNHISEDFFATPLPQCLVCGLG